jgi:hypothetical protein
MKYHESPDVPFTLLRTRFTKGFYSNQLDHTSIEWSIFLSEDVYKAANSTFSAIHTFSVSIYAFHIGKIMI